MEMETKIVKNGSSFAFAIPTAFINCNVLRLGKRYKLAISMIENAVNATQSRLTYFSI